MLAIDDRVTDLVQALKGRGLQSPYLRNFVVARINPLRFRRGVKMPVDEALDKVARAAQRFDARKIGAGDCRESDYYLVLLTIAY